VVVKEGRLVDTHVAAPAKYAKGEKTRTRGKGSDKLIIQRKNGSKITK